MDPVNALSDDDTQMPAEPAVPEAEDDDDRPLVVPGEGQGQGGQTKKAAKRPAASKPPEPEARPKPKASPKQSAKAKAKAKVKATAKAKSVLRRPAARSRISVCKSLYKRDGVWSVKVNGSELLRAGMLI